MGKSEEVITRQQTSKVMNSRANPRNIPRRQVGAFWVILWLILALVALCLWMLRLLGIMELV